MLIQGVKAELVEKNASIKIRNNCLLNFLLVKIFHVAIILSRKNRFIERSLT
jgi:hypothetical protein